MLNANLGDANIRRQMKTCYERITRVSGKCRGTELLESRGEVFRQRSDELNGSVELYFIVEMNVSRREGE